MSTFIQHAWALSKLQTAFTCAKNVWKVQVLMQIHAYLLFEGARFRIFRHHVMQGLNGDVDDATELVLDHTDDKQTPPTHYSRGHSFNSCVLEWKRKLDARIERERERWASAQISKWFIKGTMTTESNSQGKILATLKVMKCLSKKPICPSTEKGIYAIHQLML